MDAQRAKDLETLYQAGQLPDNMRADYELVRPSLQEAPEWGDEMLKAAGRGAATGALGTVEAGANLLNAGIDKAETFLGVREQNTPQTNYAGRINKSLGLEQDPNATAGQKIAGAGVEALTNPISWIGPGGPALKAGGAILGGAGSEVAGEVAHEVAPSFELPARVLGGAAGGKAAGATAGRASNAKGAARLQSQEQIHDASQRLYRVLENNPMVIPPPMMNNLADTIENYLHSKFYREYTTPSTYRALNELRMAPKSSTLGDIVNVHEALGHVVPSATYGAKDAAAANEVRAEIRNWMRRNIPQTDKTLTGALGNWSASAKMKEVEKAMEIAHNRASSTGTGSNEQNTMMQEVRKILDNTTRLRGYTPEEAAHLARLFGDGNFIEKSATGKQLIPAISRLLPEESRAH